MPVVAVEQPLAAADHAGQLELRSLTDIPVIADEAVATLADLDGLEGLADAVNIKLTKCGGVQRPDARRRSTARGTELMLGCLTASTLGLAPAVHLADRARWTDLDGHLLLAHDPWTGIGGADGACGRRAARPRRTPARARSGQRPGRRVPRRGRGRLRDAPLPPFASAAAGQPARRQHRLLSAHPVPRRCTWAEDLGMSAAVVGIVLGVRNAEPAGTVPHRRLGGRPAGCARGHHRRLCAADASASRLFALGDGLAGAAHRRVRAQRAGRGAVQPRRPGLPRRGGAGPQGRGVRPVQRVRDRPAP